MHRYLILALFLAFTLAAGVHAQDKKTKILLVGKDRDHPYASHEYMVECTMLARCLQQTRGIETIVSNGWPTDPNQLKGVKAIVLYTNNGGNVILAPQVREQVRQMVKDGVGVTAIHWGTGANKITGEEYLHILGGWFTREIGATLNTTTTRLIQADPKHPICRGWKEYDLRDEYYLNLRFLPAIHPVLKVHLEGKDHTVGWTYERPDGGRSFGFVCGHFHANFAEEPFRQAIVNGILWTVRMEVPEGGAPVSVTAKDLELPPDTRKK
jgi:type 1 glutamine amidotransferase